MNLVLKLFILTSALLCPTHCASVQTSAETLKQLQNIEASIDNSVEPCEDFYSYACGNWPKQHKNEEFGISNMMQTIYVKDIDDIILKEYPMEETGMMKKKSGQSVIEKALAYYYSCHQIRDKIDEFKFLDIVKPGAGLEWPLVQELKRQRIQTKASSRAWSAGRNFDLFSLLGQLHSYGLSNELVKSLTVYIDDGRLVTIFAKPEVAELDIDEIKFVIDEMGLSEDIANKSITEIWETHNYWQNIYTNFTKPDEAEEDDDDDNGYTYEELRQIYPKLYKFLDKTTPRHLREEGPVVGLTNGDYYKFLLAKKWSTQEIRKFTNYLMVKFVLFWKKSNTFGCSVNVVNNMPFAFHALYHKHRYLPYANDLNRHITRMTKKIYSHFTEIINENHLRMDVQQLEIINSRLNNVSINLGNLPKKMDYAVLEELYSDIPDLDVQQFYRNNLLVKQHNVLEQLKCPSPLSCRDDPDHIPYYDRSNNLLTIPFGTLKPPIYDIHFDPLLYVSAFGNVLGHELTHAIDSTTLSLSYLQFEELTQKPEVYAALECMQQQQITSSVDERIADFLGAKVAFETYSRDYNRPLKFTAMSWQKLFFLNLAQVFCSKSQDFDDEHDSSLIRLNQIVLNLKEFAEAFQCPVESKMNPSRKCRFY